MYFICYYYYWRISFAKRNMLGTKGFSSGLVGSQRTGSCSIITCYSKIDEYKVVAAWTKPSSGWDGWQQPQSLLDVTSTCLTSSPAKRKWVCLTHPWLVHEWVLVGRGENSALEKLRMLSRRSLFPFAPFAITANKIVKLQWNWFSSIGLIKNLQFLSLKSRNAR